MALLPSSGFLLITAAVFSILLSMFTATAWLTVAQDARLINEMSLADGAGVSLLPHNLSVVTVVLVLIELTTMAAMVDWTRSPTRSGSTRAVRPLGSSLVCWERAKSGCGS